MFSVSENLQKESAIYFLILDNVLSESEQLWSQGSQEIKDIKIQ